jgi:O-antigen ligase
MTADERRMAGAAPGARRWSIGYDAQALLLLLPFLWASLFTIFRPFGAPALAMALAPLIVVGLSGARRYIAPPLIVFAAITAVYAVLSYLGFLDQRLTLLFSREAVFQQCAYGLVLVFAVASFAFYHEGVAEGRPWFLRLEEVVLLLAILSRLVGLVLVDPETAGADIVASGIGLAQFVNGETFFAFIFVRRWLHSPHASPRLNIFIALCLIVTAGSAQSRLSLLALLALVIVPSLRKPITVWFLIALLGIIVAAWPFAEAVWIFDPNTGIRLFFWHDVVHRFLESHGIGVGFGTETIRPIYDLRVTDVQLQTIDSPGFILVGSHNAFLDALYRMGVLGFGCLFFFAYGLLKSVLRLRDLTIFDCWVLCLAATVLIVNVGLVSFNFFFGSTLLLGWLMYRIRRPVLRLPVGGQQQGPTPQ